MSTGTTIGALKKELTNFLSGLQQTRAALTAEIQTISQSSATFQKDYDSGVKVFVQKIVPALDGPAFDQAAALIEDLPTNRDTLLDNRASALESVKGILGGDEKNIVTVSSFSQILSNARLESQTAQAAMTTAESNAHRAQKQLAEWRRSKEYEFVQLDEQLRAQGKPGLEPATHSYYDTESLTIAAFRHLTRDDSYKQVRQALIKFQQGAQGRDVFAGIDLFKTTTQQLALNQENTEDALSHARDDYSVAQGLARDLLEHERAIISDARILAKIQEIVTTRMADPEFMKSLASAYEADFPRGLPVLAIKLKSLSQSANDAQKNLRKLDADIKVATDFSNKIKHADNSRHISFNLQDFIQNNGAYRSGYDDYIKKTRNSGEHAATWDKDDDDLTVLWNILIVDTISNERAQARNTPSFPGFGGGDSGGAGASGEWSSPLSLGLKLDNLFQDAARGVSRIDFSPVPEETTKRDDSWSTNNNDTSSISSSGSMEL